MLASLLRRFRLARRRRHVSRILALILDSAAADLADPRYHTAWVALGHVEELIFGDRQAYPPRPFRCSRAHWWPAKFSDGRPVAFWCDRCNSIHDFSPGYDTFAATRAEWWH